METAERLGISLRRLEGWEPTTRYVHDAAGRLVSSAPEPEWDDLEQGWMVALAAWRDMRCKGCGGDLAVTTDPANEGRFQPALPVQCFRCEAFSRSHQAYADEPHPHTLLHLVPQTPRGRAG